MLLMGLDIGTTACKAALFYEDGKLLTSASREYAIDIPYPRWAEQDATKVWILVQEAMRQVVAQAGTGDIAAIGLSVQGEAVMPVDEQGCPLRSMILGMDTRTDDQNSWLCERFGAQWLFQHSGMPVHTINTLPKLLWLKEHEPVLWKRAARFALYEDFLTSQMTGQAVISYCLASRTQLYDLHSACWSEPILSALSLDPSRLPTLQPSGTVIGTMKKELSHNLGFSRPPLIVCGGARPGMWGAGCRVDTTRPCFRVHWHSRGHGSDAGRPHA